MALQFDQLNNQLKTNDSTNANASMILTPSGTGSVLLNGTGQNLIVGSNAFTNATYWSVVNSTVTGSQSDPFGGSTATLWAGDGTSNQHDLANIAISFISGITYTMSAYFKKGTNNFVQLLFANSVGGGYANFDLNAGATGTVSGLTSANIVSIGNGWYRCSITNTVTASASAQTPIFLVTAGTAVRTESNTLSTNVYVYGAQLEIGSTANAYTPTTTTAIYNAPVLSFSGVSNIGLQSDGSLYVSPAGTGALQAQATTSSAVGGNARGANAVDWQMVRGAATQVASGLNSIISGGTNNTVTGPISGVLSGGFNFVSGQYAVVTGGAANNANQYACGVVAGQANQALGYFNFIGGGFTNSGTASAAVVSALATQQVTVGSLQIALTATNASIKVGQYISGTGIATNTYVTSAVATNTVSAMTSTISTTTLSVTALTGTMYIGTVLTGGSISPATAYVTAQLTATNAAAASPTASASSGSTTLVVSSATGIAVGQFVQPITGINTNTYVLAISGTSITISQATTGVITAGTAINFYTAGNTGTYSLNTSSTGTPTGGTSYTFGISQSASATGTPALSFYTPHGVVVGGGNNQATGAYSFIGGGGDAGTAANRNVASGDFSTVVGGVKNIASGSASFIGGGGFDGATVFGNTASGTVSTICGGLGNNTTAVGATVIGGYQNTANSSQSVIVGSRYGTSRGVVGYTVSPACANPMSTGTNGTQQSAILVLARQTTDATATVLASDAAAAGTTNQLILPNNSAYYVRGSIVAGVTGAGNSSSWTFQGTIKRGAGVGTTTIVGAGITASLVSQDAGAATWAVAITADTTNGGLAVTVTGAAATTIRWVCKIETTEMTY